MKKSLVIFGAGEIAELALYYFSRDSQYRVAAFTVDAAYLKADHFCGLPLLAFEEVAQTMLPATHDLFVGIGYAGVNGLRQEKYLAAREAGYRMASYVSPRATILNDGMIGDNCLVLEDTVVQPYVSIGNNVTLWSGCHVGHHSTIHDHCFIAPRVTISGGVRVGEGSFVGVNATIRDHLKVGERCVIGAGAVLLADAAPGGVYVAAGARRSPVPSSRLRKI